MHTVLRAVEAVATLGGLLCTVGYTFPVAVRCESVMFPSELAHMMTIGALAIAVPKPLYVCMSGWGLWDRSTNPHRHPSECVDTRARQFICDVELETFSCMGLLSTHILHCQFHSQLQRCTYTVQTRSASCQQNRNAIESYLRALRIPSDWGTIGSTLLVNVNSCCNEMTGNTNKDNATRAKGHPEPKNHEKREKHRIDNRRIADCRSLYVPHAPCLHRGAFEERSNEVAGNCHRHSYNHQIGDATFHISLSLVILPGHDSGTDIAVNTCQHLIALAACQPDSGEPDVRTTNAS